LELDVCIKGRRSVRAYKDEPVSKEQTEAILEAAFGRQQAWTFSRKKPNCRVVVKAQSHTFKSPSRFEVNV
jgi:hypothetical protein